MHPHTLLMLNSELKMANGWLTGTTSVWAEKEEWLTGSLPDLPPETLDSIIDFLYDEPETLRQCCLVSKSWVPRTRKHLFAVIELSTRGYIEAWKKTFQNPYNSPAYHTRILTIGCSRAIATADGTQCGWIPTFSRLVRLEVANLLSPTCHFGLRVDLAPFHKVPSTLKSLAVTSFPFPLSQFFDLIGSLPLLEDLTLIGSQADLDDSGPDGPHTVVPSSTSPTFTGILELRMYGGVASTAHRLLNLPNGLHFRKFKFLCDEWGDLRYVAQLVTGCSGTLECLDITCPWEGVVHFGQVGHLLNVLFCR